jgi:hypothetical protein
MVTIKDVKEEFRRCQSCGGTKYVLRINVGRDASSTSTTAICKPCLTDAINTYKMESEK